MKKNVSCPECEQGKLYSVIEDYKVDLPATDQIVVPHVELNRCDNCGATFIPAASSRRISEFQAEALKQLARR